MVYKTFSVKWIASKSHGDTTEAKSTLSIALSLLSTAKQMNNAFGDVCPSEWVSELSGLNYLPDWNENDYYQSKMFAWSVSVILGLLRLILRTWSINFQN